MRCPASAARTPTLAAVPTPLIVCAELDAASQELLDGLRRRHFPPGRNVVSAHLTLFHHLDGPEDEVAAVLADSAASPRLAARLGFPRSLGRGVAIDVECPALVELRRRLAGRVPGELTPQDRQWHRPHVTVANKLTPAAAKALLTSLTAGWMIRDAVIEGLSLWRYLGGPWEHAGTWPLAVDA